MMGGRKKAEGRENGQKSRKDKENERRLLQIIKSEKGEQLKRREKKAGSKKGKGRSRWTGTR